ncbi:anthrone oxygenase family protein [Mycolicibacterium pulveris]|uniref:anthrone oxygenase family protein n=1 Tax=Mycolicibacterium pulveris TaxID=36813 RepID=UPI003CE6B8AC
MGAIVGAVALLITGPMVGVELAVAVFTNPVFARLPDDGFAQARSDASGVLGKVMPFWYVAALLVLIAAAVVTWENWFIVTAAAVMALVVVMTVVLLVPINNRISRWSGPAEVSRDEARLWDRLHWRRVFLLAAMFVLLVIGLTV